MLVYLCFSPLMLKSIKQTIFVSLQIPENMPEKAGT